MSYQEEVIRQDGDWEDVKELPSQEGGLQQAGGLDQRRVNVNLDADGDGGDRDKADDHGSLDVVGDERDLESSHGCGVVVSKQALGWCIRGSAYKCRWL